VRSASAITVAPDILPALDTDAQVLTDFSRHAVEAIGVARGGTVRGFIVAAVCSGGAAFAQPAVAQGPPVAHVYLSDTVARGLVLRAISGAQRRLEQANCRRVLSDFTDPSGQPLVTPLIIIGRSPAEYLVERLWFVEDGTAPQCRADEGVAAFTAAASKVVHVCVKRFAALARRSTVAEMLIIHELLHTLGLGENPPASAEITRHVTNRCGDS
jgi:hypothetical protein